MALYMFFYVAPDSHLEFLRDNPTLFDSYLGGETPDLTQSFISRLLGKKPAELPNDWPNHELNAYSSEINHRQVEDFHYILNGTNDPVESVGGIFQTWFKPRLKTPAIAIDGENFAYYSKDVGLLLDLIESSTPELRRDRLDNSSTASELQHSVDFVNQAFGIIEKACNEAISKGQGLLWSNH